MTFQGDVMVLTVVIEIHSTGKYDSCLQRFAVFALSAESIAAFAVQDVYREEREGRKATLPLMRISRDQQSSGHWRHHRGAAYNPG